MSDDNKNGKDKSLLNPLHGGDNYKAAMELRDEDFTSLRHEDVEEKVDATNVNKIIVICSIFVLIWLLLYGLFYFASQTVSQNRLPHNEARSSLPAAAPLSLFERIFCQGARKSTFCD